MGRAKSKKPKKKGIIWSIIQYALVVVACLFLLLLLLTMMLLPHLNINHK